MTEIEFSRIYLGEFKMNGAEIIPKYCPFCHGGEHKDRFTFALNTEKHTFKCLRGSCGKQGHFSELCRHFGVEYDHQYNKEVYVPPVRRSYKLPDAPHVTFEGSELNYTARRKIMRETAQMFGVGGANGEVIFPFYETSEQFEKNKPVFIKYRPAHKIQKGESKARREKDTKPILFGMHLCDPSKDLLTIFEGEFDCLSGYQAGGINCVSVPSGCKDFTWLETCAEFLSRFSKILIMADNDGPGLEMLRELSVKLECQIFRPDFKLYQGCKDANEILYKYGEEQLKTAMESMRPQETLGLLNLADVQPVDIANIPRTLSGIPALDAMTGGLYEGDLNIWTGKRGEGKSTILTQILLEAIEQNYNVCSYSGEIPADRFKYDVCLQAAGSDYVMDYEDKQAGRVTQYVPRGTLEAINRWFDGRFWLYDNRIVEEDEAVSVIRVFEQAYRKYNCKVFLVDNLMTVRTCKRDSDFYQMQADFTIRLRKLAEKLGAVIHLVVHPRKTPKGVTDSDDVGGLGTITNIACNVFSLKKLDEDDQSEMGCDAILSCMKNRAYGELGDIRLNFLPRSRRFVQTGNVEKTYGWMNNNYIQITEEKPPF